MIGSLGRSPYFGSLANHIDHYEQRPVGIGGRLLPVAILNEDDWKPSKVIGWNGEAQTADEILEGIVGGCKIDFKGPYDAAFVRKRQTRPTKPRYDIPQNTYHLRQAGGYQLSKLLGLSIIPHTELTDLPGRKMPETAVVNAPKTDQTRRLAQFWASGHIFGTIQEWVNGTRLDDFRYAFDGTTDNLRRKSHKIFEAYIYAVVAWDPDQHDGNVMERDSDGSMTLYDTNLSGADPETAKMDDLPLQWDIEGQSLPEEYLAKLSDFVKNEKQNLKILSAYYGEKTALGFFQRARYLIDHPVVENMRTLRTNLLSQREINPHSGAKNPWKRSLPGKESVIH